jgi:hypothetical protein
MTSEDVRKFKTHLPFKPFEIRLIDGRVFEINHPDFVWLNDKSLRTVTVMGTDGREHTINTTVIVSINRTAPALPQEEGVAV